MKCSSLRHAPGLVLASLALAACRTPEQNTAAGAAAVTALASWTPAHELEQVYYVGIFDPTEQLPPSLYRLTVRGQSSAMSNVKFASGWVPAPLIDSLGSSLSFDAESGKLEIEDADAKQSVQLETGRRLVLFGPEGFRESPKDHRLVIVMGGDPSAYFQALGRVLGKVANSQAARTTTLGAQNQRLLTSLLETLRAQEELERLAGSLKVTPQQAAGSGGVQ